jgi:hypothetical protein
MAQSDTRTPWCPRPKVAIHWPLAERGPWLRPWAISPVRAAVGQPEKFPYRDTGSPTGTQVPSQEEVAQPSPSFAARGGSVTLEHTLNIFLTLRTTRPCRGTNCMASGVGRTRSSTESRRSTPDRGDPVEGEITAKMHFFTVRSAGDRLRWETNRTPQGKKLDRMVGR